MVIRVRSQEEKHLPPRKLHLYEKASDTARAVRIKYPDGNEKFTSLHDFTEVLHQHKDDFHEGTIIGYTLKYEGRIRATFNLSVFLKHASDREAAWMRERLTDLPEKPKEETRGIPVVQMQAACSSL